MASVPQIPDTTELNGVAYLFGYPIAHSMSPLLHETVYKTLQLRRAQIPFPSSDISQFLPLLADPKFFGASVTMPHKIAIMQHLDHLTDEAQEVGACNTIFVREIEGKRIFYGTNTDVVGIREAFFQNVPNYSVFRNRPGMVIGGGGAARSAVYAMKRWLHCNPIYVVNRDEEEVKALLEGCKTQRMPGQLIHVSTVEQAEQLAAPGAIVACVPDFPPATENEKRARAVIQNFLTKPRKGAILEMCYHPSPWTQLAALAQDAGWQVILGTEAMIWQGLEQDRYWTGLPLERLPVEEVKIAVAQSLTKSKL